MVHLDLRAQASPWDTAAGLDGAVIVERADLVVLDGECEDNPSGSECRDAAVDTGALVEVEAEHDGWQWWMAMLREE